MAAVGDLVYAATERGLFERDATYSWRLVAELGEARVESVWIAEGRAWARSGARLFERPLVGPGDLRFAEAPRPRQPAALPAAETATARSLPTGDERFPWLAVSSEAARLFDRERRTVKFVALPVPAEDVTSALIVEGKLLLGTAGYGVLRHQRTERPDSCTGPITAPGPTSTRLDTPHKAADEVAPRSATCTACPGGRSAAPRARRQELAVTRSRTRRPHHRPAPQETIGLPRKSSSCRQG